LTIAVSSLLGAGTPHHLLIAASNGRRARCTSSGAQAVAGAAAQAATPGEANPDADADADAEGGVEMETEGEGELGGEKVNPIVTVALHSCTYCGKQFRDRSRLVVHLRVRTSPPPSPYAPRPAEIIIIIII